MATDAPAARSAPLADGAADVVVLPWYYSWWRVALITVALTVGIAGAVALAWGGPPGAASVDVRFLQDMRTHHDQAVQMSLAMLAKDDVDPTLRIVAAEILLAQQQETGIMVEVLRGFGAAEENSTGTAMEWMDMAVPLERMPGMASDDQLAQLEAATGTEADTLFVDLMVAHHEGGIHMAEYAAEHASTGRVRDAARSMATVQTGEVRELRSIEARLGSGS